MTPHIVEALFTKDDEVFEPAEKSQPKIKYNVSMIIRMIFAHVLGFYAIVYKLQCMKIWTIAYSLILSVLAILGATAGAHRLWSHRSFKATEPLRIFLFSCFALCSHISIYNWVQFHRIHHKYPDTETDPHNSRKGFFFSHVGWLLMDKSPEYQLKKKEVDMSDILMDPLARLHSRYFLAISHALLFLPSVVPVLAWGEDPFLSFLASGILRSLVVFHSIVSINSFSHMFGSRPYNKNIQPTENRMVSFLALGEGWHNYHHTFPWDYKAAEFGDRLNVTARFLDLCAKLGLAYDLKTVSPDVVARMKEKYGDGSHTR